MQLAHFTWIARVDCEGMLRMYGMVNRAIQEWISGEYGEPAWDSLKAAAGVDCDIFISSEAYPDEITFSLLAVASKSFDLPEAEVFRRFGVHWVTHTAQRYYTDLLSAGGSSIREFLCNLPHFHQRISLLFPHLEPPRFRCSDVTDRSLRLHYYSTRAGLTHFVEGLILGLGSYFQTPVTVSIASQKSSGADHDAFLVEW